MYKKEIAKAIRSLERETHKMEQMEAKLKATVLQKGKESGKSAELRIFVKDYLRTKKAITRFYTMRSSLMGVQTTIEMTASTLALKEGLKNASRALRDMRTSVNMGEMKGILKDFGEGVGEAEALQEEMDEAIGMAMDERALGERARAVGRGAGHALTLCLSPSPSPSPSPPLFRARARSQPGRGGGQDDRRRLQPAQAGGAGQAGGARGPRAGGAGAGGHAGGPHDGRAPGRARRRAAPARHALPQVRPVRPLAPVSLRRRARAPAHHSG